MDVTLISRYYDTRTKGVGSYSELIYKGLEQENIGLKTISQEDSLAKSFNKLSYLFYTAVDLKRIINKKEYKNSDIFHSLTPLESLYLPKNKSVSTVLDFIPFYEINNLSSSSFAKLYDKAIKTSLECEKTIALNPDVKKCLISNYNGEESSIEVISPPIDAKYCPMKKNNDSYVIGTVSSLGKRKRVDLLIKAFLKADIENSKLLIGGNGEEKENLIKLSQNDDRIKFLGFIPDEKMNEFYNSLDVFVFPTILEGYGMPIVEAMACGRPVITLNDGDIPSNIKKRTHVCTKEDLSEVLINREFKCDIKENIKFYKEHSIENISSKLMKVYESI